MHNEVLPFCRNRTNTRDIEKKNKLLLLTMVQTVLYSGTENKSMIDFIERKTCQLMKQSLF